MEEETIRRFRSGRGRRKHLFEIGAIPTVEPHALQDHIHSTFEALRSVPSEERHTPEGERRYQEVVNLVVLAGIAIPVTLLDWSVNRVTAAEDALGLQEGGLVGLEEIVARKYGHRVGPGIPKPIHLEKGPGNGDAMQYLRDKSGCMEEVGVGDSLYFEMNDMLRQFVRPELKDDPVVREILRALSMALKIALREHQFEPVLSKNKIPVGTRLKGFFCELNEIFPLLTNPRGWLPKIYKKLTEALLKASVEFEHDDTERIPRRAHEWLVRYADCQDLFLHAQEQRLRALRRHIAGDIERQHKLRKLSGEIFDHQLKGTYETNFFEFHDRYVELTGEDVQWDENDLPAAVEDAARSLPVHPDHAAAYVRITEKSLPGDCTPRELGEIIDSDLEEIQERFGEYKTDAAPTESDTAKVQVQERIHRLAKMMRMIRVLLRAPAYRAGTSTEAAAHPPDLPSLVRECRSLGIASAKGAQDIPLDALLAAVEAALAQAKGEARTLEAQKTRREAPVVPGRLAPSLQSLGEIFDERFLESVRNAAEYEKPDYRRREPPLLDLNRVGPRMHIGNFAPGLFVDMSRKGRVPPASCLLITAVRSCSHEESTPMEGWHPGGIALAEQPGDFERDIRQNIDQLQPGGVLLIDGNRQSWTRIQRLWEIRRAIAGRDDIRVEVVMDPNTQSIQSVLLQRAHPAGFLTDEEKNRCFRPETRFHRLETFMKTQPVELMRSIIRRRIAKLTGNPQAFRECQADIEHELDRWVRYAATARFASYHQDCIDAKLMEEAERIVREVLPKECPAFQPGEPGNIVPPTAYDGFFKLEKRLHIGLGVEADAPPAVIDLCRRSLYRALAARCHDFYIGPGSSEQTGEPDDRLKQWDDYARGAARNDICSDPILEHSDVAAIIANVSAGLRGLVQGLEGVSLPLVVGESGLEALRRGAIHAVPRAGHQQSPFNRHYEQRIDALPTNGWFGSADAQRLLRAKSLELQSGLLKIAERLGRAPVILLQLIDSSTNFLLEQRLREMLEPHFNDLVAVQKIDLNHPGFEQQYRKNRRGHFVEQLRHGAIVIIGGSLNNPDEPPGTAFRQTYGKDIGSALKPDDSLARAVAICFGHQVMMDLVGWMEEDRGIVSRPGCLVYGPTPVTIVKRAPFFTGFPEGEENLVVVGTHTRHVTGLDEVPPEEIQIYARSSLTRQVVACGAFHGRLASTQLHPEVHMVNDTPGAKREMHNDLPYVLRDIRPLDEALSELYGVRSGDLRAMLEEVCDGRRILGNPGPHMLVNALGSHAESLIDAGILKQPGHRTPWWEKLPRRGRRRRRRG